MFSLVDVEYVEKVLEEAVNNPHNDKKHVKTEVMAALCKRFDNNTFEKALVDSFLEAPLFVSMSAFMKLQNKLKSVQYSLLVSSPHYMCNDISVCKCEDKGHSGAM